MNSKARSKGTNKKRARRAVGSTPTDRQLLARADEETAEGKPETKSGNRRRLERGERSLRRQMSRREVISWHRLQAVRLRRVADALDVRAGEAGNAWREALSLATEFEEMAKRYEAGKVVQS